MNDRISDTERDRALEALGIHFAQGRINLSEYEQRSDRALASVTTAELETLFLDLPLPHYNRGLAVRPPRAQAIPPAQGPRFERYDDPWDTRIGNSPITLRKAKRIGWVLAFAWIFLAGPVLDAILPTALVPFLLFMPMLGMIVTSIALAPVKPKYRVVGEHTDQGKYPY